MNNEIIQSGYAVMRKSDGMFALDLNEWDGSGVLLHWVKCVDSPLTLDDAISLLMEIEDQYGIKDLEVRSVIVTHSMKLLD